VSGDILSNSTALRLHYFVEDRDDLSFQVMMAWEAALRDKFPEIEKSVEEQLFVTMYAYEIWLHAMKDVVLMVMRMTVYSGGLLMIFVLISTMTGDWVTSKPLLGVLAVVSVVLSGIAGAGLLMHLGIMMTFFTMTAAIILLGKVKSRHYVVRIKYINTILLWRFETL
jgi:hypothetical protein